MNEEIKPVIKYACGKCGKVCESKEEAEEHHLFPKKLTMYLHAGDGYARDIAEELGLDGDEKFMDGFRNALYEVTFEVDVHYDGEVDINTVNGRRLEMEDFE